MVLKKTFMESFKFKVSLQKLALVLHPDKNKFSLRKLVPGEEQDECLIGTWFGKQSVEEDRHTARSQANKMVESLKFIASQLKIYEGSEPILFFAIFQSFVVLKGGLSEDGVSSSRLWT